MKILAYERSEVKAAVDKCAAYLMSRELGSAHARTWNRLMSFCDLDNSSLAIRELQPTYSIQRQHVLLLLAAIYTIEFALLNAIREEKGGDAKKLIKLLEKKVGDAIADLTNSNVEYETKILRRLKSSLEADMADGAFDSNKSYNWAIALLDEKLGEIQDQISITGRILADFNSNSEPRTYFDHVFWYDIVDSTATKFATHSTPEKIRDYKKKISRFRDSVSRRLSTICEEHTDNDNLVLPWNGTVESKNDEKHIFFHGQGRVSATLKTIASLISITKQNPGVRFRAILLPCDFTGDSYASSTPTSAEVEGEVFLTHFD